MIRFLCDYFVPEVDMSLCNQVAVVVLHHKFAATARELGQAVAMQHDLFDGVGNVVVVVG